MNPHVFKLLVKILPAAVKLLVKILLHHVTAYFPKHFLLEALINY